MLKGYAGEVPEWVECKKVGLILGIKSENKENGTAGGIDPK